MSSFKSFSLISRLRALTVVLFLFVFTPVISLSQEILAEAEDGVLSGTLTVSKALSGYSGRGYVSKFENSNDRLTMSVQVTTAGTYDVFVGYCAEYGTKTINVEVDGKGAKLEIPQLNGKFNQAKFATLTLKAGDIPVVITPNWTWFHIDFVRFVKVDDVGGEFSISPRPVNNAANQSALNLWSFLRDNYLRKCISGVMTLNSLSSASNEITYLKGKTGKEPALLGLLTCPF